MTYTRPHSFLAEPGQSAGFLIPVPGTVTPRSELGIPGEREDMPGRDVVST